MLSARDCGRTALGVSDLKGTQAMYSFARRLHSQRGHEADKPSSGATKGAILNQGWRYDLTLRLMDIVLFRGQVRTLRRRTADLANIRLGERALDVGCGTGTLALDLQRRVGAAGFVAGVDPGPEQIAYARLKAARRHAPVDFQVGVIERLPFSDQSFDVVFSTLMMHPCQTASSARDSRRSSVRSGRAGA